MVYPEILLIPAMHAKQQITHRTKERSLLQRLYAHIALTYEYFNYVKLGKGIKYLKEHLLMKQYLKIFVRIDGKRTCSSTYKFRSDKILQTDAGVHITAFQGKTLLRKN